MRFIVLLGFVALLAGCAGATTSTSSPSSEAPAPPTRIVTASPAPSGEPADLVGEWERETRCDEVVASLKDAGLEQWIPEVAAGFVPGAAGPEAIEDPSDPCRDAVSVRHSHFFTAGGQFGSRDQNGAQVDDGTYRIVDEGTFVVSKEFPDVTFHYEVEGDSISFEPVIPECSPDCFEAAWSVAVAFPGHAWKRVPEN